MRTLQRPINKARSWGVPRLDIKDPSLYLYLPLWYPYSDMTGITTIYSYDKTRYACTLSAPVWTSKGRLFDAVDDQITFGDTTTLAWMHGKGNTTAFKWTFLCWFNQLHPGTAIAGFLDTSTIASANTGVVIRTDTSRKIRLYIPRGAVGTVVADITTVNAYANSTDFNCLAITYDQSLASANANFYLNGVWLESGDKTANAPNDANSTYAPVIGRGATGIGAFDGTNGEIRLYNRVLSAGEIAQYNNAARWRWK